MDLLKELESYVWSNIVNQSNVLFLCLIVFTTKYYEFGDQALGYETSTRNTVKQNPVA